MINIIECFCSIAATFAMCNRSLGIIISKRQCPAVLFKCKSCTSLLLPWHLAPSYGKHGSTTNLDDLECAFATVKDCTNDDATLPKLHLSTHNVPELHAILKRLSVTLLRVV